MVTTAAAVVVMAVTAAVAAVAVGIVEQQTVWPKAAVLDGRLAVLHVLSLWA